MARYCLGRPVFSFGRFLTLMWPLHAIYRAVAYIALFSQWCWRCLVSTILSSSSLFEPDVEVSSRSAVSFSMPDKILLAIFALYMPLSLASSEQQCAEASKGIGEELIMRGNGKRGSEGGAVIGEHSPPTNVARVQILASTPYVGWVFKFQFNLERTDTFKRVHMNSFCFVGKTGIYNFFFTIYNFRGGGWKRGKLDAWYKRTNFPSFLRPLVAVNFRLVRVLVLVFPSSSSLPWALLFAPGSRRLHFVINFSLLICNILATLYMLNFSNNPFRKSQCIRLSHFLINVFTLGKPEYFLPIGVTTSSIKFVTSI